LKKYVLALILITLGVYANTLFNGFVGDDHAIIVENTFYAHVSDLPRLFSKDYTTDPLLLNQGPGRDYGSGSVAYRPVLSLTYFLDHALWGTMAPGYHLTNLVLHLLNVVLVFALFLVFMIKPPWAFFAALLFAVHPVQTEAICAIGYRGDLLVTFFVLVGCLCWVRFREGQRKIWAILTLAAYFLAVFSKEAALLMPVLLWIYDRSYKSGACGKADQWRWGGVFALIGAFYLWVYLWVFPNPSLYSNLALGKTIAEHVSVVLRIWEFNIFSLIFPWLIATVPPLYTLAPIPLTDIYLILSLCLSMFVIAGVYFCFKTKQGAAFWLAWFLLFYIPVSGIMATPNPVAYRFLYLPGIGFFAIAGYGLYRFSEMAMIPSRISVLIRFFIVAVCCVFTFSNNFLWRNNQTISKQWIRDFPGHYKGHAVLGIEYFRQFRFAEAVEVLEPFWHDLGKSDPSALYCLAEGHFQLGHRDKAAYFFDELIKGHPYFADAYFGLGKVFLAQGNAARALVYFRKAMEIDPKDMYFKYIGSRARGAHEDRQAAGIVVEALKLQYGERFSVPVR